MNRDVIKDAAIKALRVLLVDEAHTNNVDTELMIVAILHRIGSLHKFKLVVMSAMLDIGSFYHRAMGAGVYGEEVDHLVTEQRTKPIEVFVLQHIDGLRDNLEMAVRAVMQFHDAFPREYKGTKEGICLVFVSGNSKISIMSDMLGNMQNRRFTANLHVNGFRADLSYKDKDMLTSSPSKDVDDKGRTIVRRKLLTANAQCARWGREDERQLLQSSLITKIAQRAVAIATNPAETGVTFDNCMLVADTCLVNVAEREPSTNVKVQATMPCSEAAADQRAGSTGRTCEG